MGWPDFFTAHDKCSANRLDIEASEQCGCFYCLSRFKPAEVVHWVPDAEGDTAVCPHCGIDSVLGSASGYAITPELLATMHGYWFGKDGQHLTTLSNVVKEVMDDGHVHLVGISDLDDDGSPPARAILTDDESEKWRGVAVPKVVAIAHGGYGWKYGDGPTLMLEAKIVYY